MTEGSPLPTNDNRRPGEQFPLAEDFVMALRFYSRLPSGRTPHLKPSLDRIAPVLPLASLSIGLLPALVLLALQLLGTPPFFAAAVATALYVIATGAMAEDALADSADGLFGGHSIDDRLAIMKDSRHGTYGVCAIVLLLSLRMLAAGSAPSALEAAGIFLAAPIIARSGALWLTIALPAARSGGAAANAGQPSRRSFAVGLGLVALISFAIAGFAVGVVGLVFAALLCGLVALGWVVLCRRLIGGQTGDLIGALQALLEIAALTAFMLFV